MTHLIDDMTDRAPTFRENDAHNEKPVAPMERLWRSSSRPGSHEDSKSYKKRPTRGVRPRTQQLYKYGDIYKKRREELAKQILLEECQGVGLSSNKGLQVRVPNGRPFHPGLIFDEHLRSHLRDSRSPDMQARLSFDVTARGKHGQRGRAAPLAVDSPAVAAKQRRAQGVGGKDAAPLQRTMRAMATMKAKKRTQMMMMMKKKTPPANGFARNRRRYTRRGRDLIGISRGPGAGRRSAAPSSTGFLSDDDEGQAAVEFDIIAVGDDDVVTTPKAVLHLLSSARRLAHRGSFDANLKNKLGNVGAGFSAGKASTTTTAMVGAAHEGARFTLDTIHVALAYRGVNPMAVVDEFNHRRDVLVHEEKNVTSAVARNAFMNALLSRGARARTRVGVYTCVRATLSL